MEKEETIVKATTDNAVENVSRNNKMKSKRFVGWISTAIFLNWKRHDIWDEITMKKEKFNRLEKSGHRFEKI